MADTDSAQRPPTMVEAWRRYDDDEQRLSAHVSERMLDLAGLHPGSRVLDIATGRGEPAIRAVGRVDPGGCVVGTDPSADMLDFARARAAKAGVGNLQLLVTHGEALEGLPTQPFDAALCRWGFMFFERPVAALAAVRRHLAPGGPLVSALWTAPESVSWWSAPRRVLARHVPQPPVSFTASGPFRYARSEAFRHDLEQAGYAFEHEETLDTAVMETADADGLIDWCLAFGIARALVGQPGGVRDAWMRDMRAEAERHRDPDGKYRLGGTTRLVVARAA